MEPRVPLFAREEALAAIKPEILERVGRIVEGGTYIQGEDVAAFEDEFAAYIGRDHCVGVANGTDALMIGLLALGVKRGDDVVVPAVTFFATAEAVAAIGARPVFADVDPATWTVTRETVAAALTGATTAIVPVHLFGATAPMDELMALAGERGLLVLEDAAQAAGARLARGMAGSAGHGAAFSFYPGKNLGAIGDAGAFLTDDPEVAALAVRLREHGSADRRTHTEIGFNSRLDSIQAAALRVALPHLDRWTEARRGWAEMYDAELAGTVGVPARTSAGRHCFHLYVVSVEDRDGLRDSLEKDGIEARAYYVPGLPSQPALREFPSNGPLPGTAAYERRALAIPMGESLGEDRLDRVVAAIRRWADR